MHHITIKRFLTILNTLKKASQCDVMLLTEFIHEKPFLFSEGCNVEFNKIYHCDWMKNDLPDKCANLIISDPPYFEVKGEFDFIWNSFEDYLKDVERWAVECKRLLADNGTLFWYGHAKKIAYSQVIFDKYFNLENNLVWNKAEKDGLFGQTGSDTPRSFPPCTERILMYSNEISMTVLEKIKLDVNNLAPLRQYFKEFQEDIGLSIKQINSLLGHRKAEHAFYWNSTQWDLPTPETYAELCRFPQRNGFLRREYEDLRRPFNNIFNLNEVLNYRFEINNYKHDTCKPEKLTRALILTCSRPGDLVLVPFAGSGTECAMAAKEGRRFIGYDVNEKYVNISEKRIKIEQSKLKLF